MPLDRPTLEMITADVQAAIEARLPGADATARLSVLGALALVFSGGVHGLYGFIEQMARQLLPSTADADWLERHGQVWGVPRLVAAYASGLVRFTGAEGTIIPVGTRVRRAGGLEYVTDAAVAVVAGIATVPAAASQPGVAGNLSAGLTLTLTAPIAGITAAVVHDGGMTGGSEPETDAAYRARILERIQNPPSGGAAADYRRWARAQAGVTRVWVAPNTDGSNIVIIRLMMDALFPGAVPDQTAIERVAAAIAPLRPVTADVRVQAPELWPVAVTLALEPDTETTRATVAAALNDLFLRDGAPGVRIPLTRVQAAVSSAAGVSDYVLTAPTADLAPPAGALPLLGAITWGAWPA
jgi:uncharacterized phage protein gp47/JayE